MKHIQEDHNRTKCPKCEKMIAANLMDRHSEEHITRERISKGKKVKKSSTAGAKKGKNPYHEFVAKRGQKSNRITPCITLDRLMPSWEEGGKVSLMRKRRITGETGETVRQALLQKGRMEAMQS